MIPDTMLDLMNESPLPPNGEWWAGESWQETHDVWGEHDAREALGEVSKYFTRERARRLTWRGRHPFLFDYGMRAGRDELVLLGQGLRKLGPRRIGPRLLTPEHYVRAKAEIRAGLILASFGKVVHEPDGAKVGGPDWRVSLGGRFGLRVEVKCPGRSEASTLRERAVAALMHGFIRGFGDLPGLDTVAWLTIAPDDELINDVVRRGFVDESRMTQVGLDAGACARAQAWPLPDGRYNVDGFGAFAVRRGAGHEPRLWFDGTAIPSDPQHEAERLRDDLLSASKQLRGTSSDAAVVALDAAIDSQLPSRTGVIADALAEDWAASISGVLIVHDVSASVRRQYGVSVVPGQARHEAFDALCAALAA